MSATSTTQFRVRYSETDQMGTFYNAHALVWFECGRTGLLRSLGLPYTEIERRGVLLPLTEAHVEFLGRARYDDLLTMKTTATNEGRARVRFSHEIAHEDGRPVARGWTIHAYTDATGKAIRPPDWLTKLLASEPGATD